MSKREVTITITCNPGSSIPINPGDDGCFYSLTSGGQEFMSGNFPFNLGTVRELFWKAQNAGGPAALLTDKED